MAPSQGFRDGVGSTGLLLNRFPPPPLSFFGTLRPLGEAAPLEVDIGGLSFQLQGSDGPLRGRLEERYGPFLSSEAARPFRVQLLDAQTDHFVLPEEAPSGSAHPLSLAWEGRELLVRSFGFAGWISTEAERGAIALARSEYEQSTWSVENYLRVATAWRALREGGVLLHAASLILKGKGFLFLGASGSGKSTLASTSRQGEVLSDDLSLVRFQAGVFKVAGTPFRGTYQGGRPVRGEFPIAGLYRILKSKENKVEPCPRNRALPILLAASPFVVDQLSRDAQILDNLRRLSAAHPLAYLHFNLSGDFWSVLPT